MSQTARRLRLATLPERLRALRLATPGPLTQAEAAALAGVSDAAIGHYEAGRAEPPLRVLRLLADAYGVTLAALLEGVAF